MFPELGPFLFQILLYIMYMGTLLVSASQYQISSTTLTKHQPRSYDLFGTDRADNVWALGWLTPMWMFVVLVRSGSRSLKGKRWRRGEERRRKCGIQICLTKARLVLTCHVLSTPLYFIFYSFVHWSSQENYLQNYFPPLKLLIMCGMKINC